MELPKEVIEKMYDAISYEVYTDYDGNMCGRDDAAVKCTDIAATHYTAKIEELEAEKNGWNETYLKEAMEHMITKQTVSELEKELERRTGLLKEMVQKQRDWQSYKEEHGIKE